MSVTSVAIIGAGLSGLSLALALQRQSIPATVFETRPESYSLGGGVTLSPNALRILDRLGVLDRVRDKGHPFDKLSYVGADSHVQDTYYFGSVKLYGYSGYRFQRQILLDEMKAMLEAQKVPIYYNSKFIGISEETFESVTFEINSEEGSSVHTASVVIGADGIHSTVRSHLFPEIKPVYFGFAAIHGIVPRSSLRIPDDYPLPVTVMGPAGAFLLVPQEDGGSQLLVATQHKFTERDRAGWQALAAGKQGLKNLLAEGKAAWPDIVQSAIDAVPVDTMGVWRFYTVPPLPTWVSEGGRIVLVGDAAHAIPPAAGQGVNQAFEDVSSLALLLARAPKLGPALEFWLRYRQDRVAKVSDLSKQLHAKRLPPAEQAKLPPGDVWSDQSATCGEGGELMWLYGEDADAVVEKWLRENE